MPAFINLFSLMLLLTTGCLIVKPASAMGLLGDTNPYMTKSAAETPAAGNDINQMAHTTVIKFLPDSISQSDKLRAFQECRRECIAKCDRLVYIYTDKKEFCHDCIRQCMLSFLQQARSLGIDFNTQPAAAREQMQGDAPADSAGDKKNSRRRRGGGGGGNKRRRNKRKQRRERREKERQQRQALLKNCIVHK